MSPSGRRMLRGFKEIAEHLGLHHGAANRRLLKSWIEREGLPAREIAGRWYAIADEVEGWWRARQEQQGGRIGAGSRGGRP